MKEFNIGDRVEVEMHDGSDNAGVILQHLGYGGYELKLDLATEDGDFTGVLVQQRDPEFFWECKLK